MKKMQSASSFADISKLIAVMILEFLILISDFFGRNSAMNNSAANSAIVAKLHTRLYVHVIQ